MSPRLRALLLVLGTLLFALLAYLPLFRAGLLADDYAVLIEAGGDRVAALPGQPEPTLAPFARLSLAVSRAAWGIPGEAHPHAAFALRLEQVLLLTLGAFGLGCATRRLLLPWTGSNHARAAGWAATLFLTIHPLAVAAVASLRARGSLLAVCLSAWALALFLKGRQDRRRSLGAVVLVLSVLAGMSAELALALPFLLAASELLSAHRYRPIRVRLRTATTTLVVFGLAAGLEMLLRVGRGGIAALPAFVRVLAGTDGGGVPVAKLMGRGIEGLGLLVLPSNPFVTELAGLALAGAVFLLAMHPGLAAARSAPRLWGWVLLVWFLSLLGSELFSLHVQVDHAEFARARVLLSSAAVMAVGLAIGSTALSGSRRILYPFLVATGYTALAHANGLPWRLAAEVTADVRSDLLQARERFGADVRLLLLDPPENVRGLRPVGRGLSALVHPFLDAGRTEGGGRGLEVLGLSREAFAVLADQPEIDELRAAGAVVVFPTSPLGGEEEPSARERRSLFLPVPGESGRPLSWRGTLRSPNLDVEGLKTGAIVVSAPLDPAFARDPTAFERLQRVSWRSRERSLPDGSCPGFWYVEDGVLHGIFHVGSSLSWRLGDRIKRVWFEGGLEAVDQVSVERDLPSLGELRPRVLGRGSWSFPEPRSPLVQVAGADARFVCVLFDLVTDALTELPVTRTPEGRLVVAGAMDLLRTTHHPFVWRLELRVGDLVVARSAGRSV